jgi:regulator of CtrA degradation
MQTTAYFRGPFEETMALLVEARTFMMETEWRDRQKVDGVKGLLITNETFRLTSRLTQVMSWLMFQRAVHDGEISAEYAMEEQFRLSEHDVCLDTSHSNDAVISRDLRSLLNRSHQLFLRIERLESMFVRTASRQYTSSNSDELHANCGHAETEH